MTGPANSKDGQLRALSEEAISLFDLLPTVHSDEVRVGAATALVPPALLAKARDDFAALLEASMAGRTSASAMISRALLETTIAFFYLTSGTRPRQEHKTVRFIAVALVDEEQQSLTEEAMRARHEAGKYHKVTDPDMRAEALTSTVEKLKLMEGQLPTRLLAILMSYHDRGAVPGYSRVAGQLAGIKAHPQVVSNLVGGYQRYYSPFSAFVHPSACVKYLAGTGGSEDTAMGLRRGRFPVGHFTPLEIALLYVPDLLRRYDERFRCGQADRIEKLARDRWTVIMGLESGGGETTDR